MTSLHIFLARLRGVFFKRRLEEEMRDEIQTHIEMQIEDLVSQGMDREEAHYMALRKFGGVDQVKEVYRERRTLPLIETFFQDVRYGLRMMRRSPGMTAVAIFSLALGIGANTALFSVVDAVLLRTLPVQEPNQLVIFEWKSGRPFRVSGMSGTSNVATSPDERGLSLFRHDVFEQMRKTQAGSTDSPLTDLFAFAPVPEVIVKLGEQPEVINAQAVSGNYFSGLRLQAVTGRVINLEDDRIGAQAVVMLSHKFWTDRFGANSSAIGQQLKLNQQLFTIIGVTPPTFNGTLQVGYVPDVTIPFANEPQLRGDNTLLKTAASPGVWWVNVMGRLKPGATQEQARQSLNGTFQSSALAAMPPPRRANQPAQLEPKDYPNLGVQAGNRGMMDRRKSYAATLYGLFIVVALVLLIACVNLANLLLARASLRGPEIKVRLAVGAGRVRLVRQLLTESLLLATLGGVVGVLFAFWFKGVISAFTDEETGLFPGGVDLSMNWRVLGFTLGVSLLTGLLFGIAPAWRATNLDLNTTLKLGGRSTGRVSLLSKGLLVMQVSVSALLLVGAGLFIRTLYNLQRVDLGFDQSNLLVFSIQPEQAGYADEKLQRFYEQLFERLDHLPGVRAATFGRVPLIAHDNWSTGVLLPGETPETTTGHITMRQMIRENYFDTMGIALLRGREFTRQDDSRGPTVAIVNQSFHQTYFPNQDILGKHVTVLAGKRDVEIVGVVADSKYQSQRDQIEPLLYTPWQQDLSDIGVMNFALRTTNDPTTVIGQLREVVHSLDSNLPITDLATQSDRSQATLSQEILYTRLFSFFGALALALAGIGLFGLLAYSVSQRTKEIGVRMAFGARMINVILMVVWQGMKLVLLGLSIAALIGYAIIRLFNKQYFGPDTWQQRMKEQLFGVTLSDPLTLIAIASLLSVVALLACWLPARRAAKVDPLIALRYE